MREWGRAERTRKRRGRVSNRHGEVQVTDTVTSLRAFVVHRGGPRLTSMAYCSGSRGRSGINETTRALDWCKRWRSKSVSKLKDSRLLWRETPVGDVCGPGVAGA